MSASPLAGLVCPVVHTSLLFKTLRMSFGFIDLRFYFVVVLDSYRFGHPPFWSAFELG